MTPIRTMVQAFKISFRLQCPCGYVSQQTLRYVHIRVERWAPTARCPKCGAQYAISGYGGSPYLELEVEPQEGGIPHVHLQDL